MKTNCTILLVEDNLKILDANRRILEADGMTVLTAASLAEARRHLQEHTPDVAVLDIMLPDGDGLEFLPELRRSCDAPVLFLTAKGERGDRLAGLRAGGNDYITKPYDIDEFLERVNAFLRLASGLRARERFTFGALEFDIARQVATAGGRELPLTRREFGIMLYLARNAHQTAGAQEVYEAVWGQPLTESTVALDSTVSRLRKKLAGSGYTISKEYRGGYCIERGESE